MRFRSRDLMKFGILYLNDGWYNDQDIISKSWIEYSLTPNKKTTWDFGRFKEDGYGYLWYIGKINNYNAYAALGHGGQMIMNIPQLKLTIIITARWALSTSKAWDQERQFYEMISKYILPAVQS